MERYGSRPLHKGNGMHVDVYIQFYHAQFACESLTINYQAHLLCWWLGAGAHRRGYGVRHTTYASDVAKLGSSTTTGTALSPVTADKAECLACTQIATLRKSCCLTAAQ